MQTGLDPKYESIQIKSADQELRENHLPQIPSVKDILVRGAFQPHSIAQRKNFECEQRLLFSLYGEHRPFCQKTDQEVIHHFCNCLIFDAYREIADLSQIDPIFHRVREEIAKVIFLSTESMEKAIEIIKGENPLSEIEKEIKKSFGCTKGYLEYIFKSYQKINFSAAVQVRTVIIPLEIAKILCLPNGKINQGLIPLIINEFLQPKEGELLNWARQARQVLELLNEYSDLIEMVENVTEPLPENVRSQDLIRATLDLPPTQLAGAREARIAVLAALMHGPVGKSFEFCTLHWCYHALMARVIADLTTLIQEGCLVRHENGLIVEFPMAAKIYEENDDELWCIESSGQFENGRRPWDLPSIQSLCQQLGYDDVEKSCKATLSFIFNCGQAGPLKIKKSQFVFDLALRSPRDGNEDEKQFLGLMAVNSKIRPPLLHALTASYGALLHQKKQACIQEKLDRCWRLTFREILKFETLPVDPDLIEHEQQLNVKSNQKIQKTLEEIFRQRLMISTSMDPSGGFYELFEDHAETEIVEFADFKNFAKRNIRAVQKKITEEENSELEKAAQKNIFKKLREIVGKTRFVHTALSNYSPALARIKDWKLQWEAFKQLPRIGKTEALELSLDLPFPSQIIHLKNGEERVIEIVEFLRSLKKKYDFEYPSESRHSLLQFVTTTDDVGHLILKQTMPCHEVITSKITEEQIRSLQQVSQRLIPEGLLKLFNQAIQQVSEEDSTLGEYAGKILEYVIEFRGANSGLEVGEAAALLSDGLLHKVLTKRQLDILQSARIELPIFKKNDHKFVFTVNPLSRNLEIFKWENEERLIPLNQYEWNLAPWGSFAYDLIKDAESVEEYFATRKRIG